MLRKDYYHVQSRFRSDLYNELELRLEDQKKAKEGTECQQRSHPE